MNHTRLMRAALMTFAAAALLGAGYFAGARFAPHGNGAATSAAAGAANTANTANTADKIDPKTGRKVLYWHDPMVPNQHFDKPGKSPFMNMPLEPVYADDGGGAVGVRIDPGLQQNLGIRYATVRRRDVDESIDAIGTTQFDESRSAVVQSRVTGYIDRLYASAPMQRIAKGAPVASLFVPDWLAPQEEYLALKRGGMEAELLAASRARMRALSIPDSVIASLDRTGRAQTHVALASPETGVVSELNVRDGAMVTPGQTIAKIAGLSTLWLVVDVPESLASDLRPGLRVDATFAGDPRQRVKGTIREILPGVSATTRTQQARLEIDNHALALTPGMLMRVRVGARKAAPRLVVPSEAVIATGKRSVVIVRSADGRLRPADVTAGRDVGDETEVLGGLSEGETVVASGQFLIDSEASLKSVLPRLEADASGTRATTGDAAAAHAASAASSSAAASSRSTPTSRTAAAPTYETIGKIENITATDITFSHRPVPALGWGAMTMSFGKPAPDAFASVKTGDTVRFAFKATGDGYQLTKVEPVGGAR
ncbi:efflux RND transporter periplasmic adaptor subunit [Burkholderia oklahomensis]|uniref:efflux RND transporter periplasmic adaptor subunit n=1 Tax=Burkholderia oklahomensis TaxID=342113 RepID=UPI0002D862EF|nr:efflux RND transporter periplasmic adaptor subunit [Burkholderia oklahomensis]AJX33451.1 efflux transporter, RND family, MFP subunit [Burkholderia oklahomensis C6786]AOI47380.1 RND transporter MFP subunit [Burkholderia oklahomensis C6786]KUY61851.1 RND transporter MFP subunit [Burkholderia oklahomensis C6786]MBI0359904.1 efflux RND transporter periplasmic adaptor subunit [Burkholderia oklahomensis]SUW59289.1 Cation efflux system protein CusB precursor [Burkholderia oklahomensis]